MRPSSVMATFISTSGRRCWLQRAKPSFSRRASLSQTPRLVPIPAARSASIPWPATAGLGSMVAATTRPSPAAISASVHGGVRPSVVAGLQGDVSRAARAAGRRRAARGLESGDLRVVHKVVFVPALADQPGRSHPESRNPRPGSASKRRCRAAPAPAPAASSSGLDRRSVILRASCGTLKCTRRQEPDFRDGCEPKNSLTLVYRVNTLYR